MSVLEQRLDAEPTGPSNIVGRLDIPLLTFGDAVVTCADEAQLADDACRVNLRTDLRACEAAKVDELIVAESLKHLLRFTPLAQRLDLLRSISEELSQVKGGERVPYRYAVLTWYVKMWWAGDRVEQRRSGPYRVATRQSWVGLCGSRGSVDDASSDLDEALVQFLQAFAAYASEAVLLSGLEAKNLEILLDAFAEAILDFETHNETYTPMTSVAQFAASGAPAKLDGQLPSCKDVLGSLIWVAVLTSTEHKLAQRGRTRQSKRSSEDISRMAQDYGLQVDFLQHVYNIVRQHPIVATCGARSGRERASKRLRSYFFGLMSGRDDRQTIRAC